MAVNVNASPWRMYSIESEMNRLRLGYKSKSLTIRPRLPHKHVIMTCYIDWMMGKGVSYLNGSECEGTKYPQNPHLGTLNFMHSSGTSILFLSTFFEMQLNVVLYHIHNCWCIGTCSRLQSHNLKYTRTQLRIIMNQKQTVMKHMRTYSGRKWDF